MNVERLHAVYQAALHYAAQAEERRHRSLGPIHLLKYAYLADFEWSKRHGGTWTGVPWRFYNFGPWDSSAWAEVGPAVREIGGFEQRVPSRVSEDSIRYSLPASPPTHDPGAVPIEIRTSLKRLVHRFGSDTSALLHEVYLSAPMRAAAPGESLSFVREPEETSTLEQESLEQAAPRSPLTPKQRKRRKEVLEDFGAQLRARLAARETPASTGAAPTYDAVFFEGITWLDGLAGGPVPEGALAGRFEGDVWHAPMRKVNDVP